VGGGGLLAAVVVLVADEPQDRTLLRALARVPDCASYNEKKNEDDGDEE
jgi:hypothetical protein